MTQRESCPVCESRSLEEILHVDRAPVLVGTIWPSLEEALDAPVGEIGLTVCHLCGFIFNSAFEPEALAYSPGFDIALHHSATYQAYLEAEATRLIETYDIRHGTVVEIGCGGGHFLRLICGLGESDGFGFDPTLQQSRVDRIGANTVTLSNELFDSSADAPPPDLVVCRSVLESIADPVSLLATIREATGDKPDTVIYFEVPNASWVFTQQRAWNVYYEHCSYFTLDLLPRLFEASGFETLACAPCYDDDQHLRIDARPGALSRERPPCSNGRVGGDVARLPEGSRGGGRGLAGAPGPVEGESRRVAIWGAGGRGITFLNTVCDEPAESLAQIEFAIDINPARQGKFLPSTGQEVLAPSELLRRPVDVVIVTNATYETEVRAELEAMGVSCDVLVL